ncbi:MAG: SDR family oxidoreductase [Coriobacteriales bacterium]|nr:SDR family oxidoreductase [Coriobacteriales bacterium]
MKQYDLQGRVALITGASSRGIGSASAALLAAAGAKVFLAARRQDKLEEVAAEITAAGGEAAYLAGDVSEEAFCQAAVEGCVARFGRLDIMVLSAGISGLSSSTAQGFDNCFDTDNWRNVLGTNLDGTFFMIKYGYAECAKGGVGSIIMVGSLASWKYAGSGAYTATKGAIRSLTHFFAGAFAPLKIRVNTIYPGMIDTDMTHGAVENETYREMFLAGIPLKRIGTPEDIGNCSLFLASDASSFITGQHFVVDGGDLID